MATATFLRVLSPQKTYCYFSFFQVPQQFCKEYTSKYRKFYAIWLRRKRQQQHEQRRLSARPVTASTTSGTTCATSTSPSTTPMTMLTSTIAWCTPCVERARRAHSFTLDVVSHLIGSSPESCHKHLHSHPWAHLLASPLPFYFHLFFPCLFSSTSCTPSCTLSSTT